jgi:hypothetical protein
MRIIIQNNRIVATATDDYTGTDSILDTINFDISKPDDYEIIDNTIVLTVKEPT